MRDAVRAGVSNSRKPLTQKIVHLLSINETIQSKLKASCRDSVKARRHKVTEGNREM